MLSNIVHLLPAGRNHSFSIMPDKYKTVNILHQIKNPRSLLRGFCFTGYEIYSSSMLSPTGTTSTLALPSASTFAL